MTPYEGDPTDDFAFLHREIGPRWRLHRFGAVLLVLILLLGVGATTGLLFIRSGIFAVVPYLAAVAIVTRLHWRETNAIVSRVLLVLFLASVVWLLASSFGQEGTLEFRVMIQGRMMLFRVIASLMWLLLFPQTIRRLWRGEPMKVP